MPTARSSLTVLTSSWAAPAGLQLALAPLVTPRLAQERRTIKTNTASISGNYLLLHLRSQKARKARCAT